MKVHNVDNSAIALIALVLAVVSGVVGAFAYLMGEIRKVGNSAKRDNDMLRDHFMAGIASQARAENDSRGTLRSDMQGLTGRIELELRALAERSVRREDMQQIDVRQTRAIERLEGKLDQIALLYTNARRAKPDQLGDGK